MIACWSASNTNATHSSCVGPMAEAWGLAAGTGRTSHRTDTVSGRAAARSPEGKPSPTACPAHSLCLRGAVW
jgi:hypothetical protein